MLISDTPNAKNPQSDRLTPCIGGCGVNVPYSTTNRVCCEKCSKERRRETYRKAAEVQRRKKGVAKVKGETAACANEKCQNKIVRRTRTHRFCDECSKAHASAMAREKSKATFATAEGRSYAAKWQKNRRETDPAYRIARNFTSIMHKCLGKKKAGRSWKKYVPYTIDELMRHLERQFLPGMSWELRGKIHIDHIVPRSSFHYESIDDPEFSACWALSNLRPIWAIDNLKKNATRTHLI